MTPERAEKPNLHPRNPHRFRYDFAALTAHCPELAPFVSVNEHGDESIDFANAAAVKMLNKAILGYFYGVQQWDIPKGYLCPPVPGRADYIHYVADLLGEKTTSLATGNHILGLDVGVGASCVYPIIGHKSYGWQFVGTDTDPVALRAAQKIIDHDSELARSVECRLQPDSEKIFANVVRPTEFFDFTICNPPFHASMAEASAGTQRKWQNLRRNNDAKSTNLNFGGQPTELWCEGGEEAFLKKMIEQSTAYSQRCLWFTSLVSKKTTLPTLYKLLQKVRAVDVETIEMAQGQKVSRMVAWTFLSNYERNKWKQTRW